MDSLDAFQGTYNEKLIQMATQQRIPITGTFELLPTCNMHCKMCYIEHTPKREELQPVDFWVDVFEQAVSEGLLFPLLTGGEAFLYPNFSDLYERISKMPVYLVINTNATLLDRETVKWLAKKPPRRLNISLYGASDETYASLCRNPNGFTQVTRAFELLKEYNIDFRVHSMMTPENAHDYHKIVELCNGYQVPLAVASYAFPAYRKEQEVFRVQDRFAPVEMAQVAFQHLKTKYKGREKEYEHHLALHCRGIEEPSIYGLYNNNASICRAGKCAYWVGWRGTVSGCGVHHQNAIDLHRTSFKDAWKQIVADTENIRISEKCKTCKYRCICPVCPAACFCETSCMNGTPEYLCSYCEEYAKLMLEERKRIFGV